MNLLFPLTQFISTIQAVPNCGFNRLALIKEPVNAVTNIFYFAAGIRLYQEYRYHRLNNPYLKALIFLSFATGILSTIHHSLPTNFTLFLDGIPIYLIFSMIIFIFTQAILTLSKPISLVISLLYLVLLMFASPYLPVETVPVLKFYFVHTLFFFLLIAYSWLRYGHLSLYLFLSISSFWLGMAFFFSDLTICSFFPLGTHFVWHFFSSLSFYLTCRFFIEFFKPRQLVLVTSSLKSLTSHLIPYRKSYL